MAVTHLRTEVEADMRETPGLVPASSAASLTSCSNMSGLSSRALSSSYES